MKRIIFSTAIAALLFSSCKKDDGIVSREEALSTGKWRITAHSSSFFINGVYREMDFFAAYLDCEKATLITFPKQDGSTIQYTPGSVPCAPGSVPSGWYPSYLGFTLIKNSSVLRYYDVQGVARDFTIDYMDRNIIKTTSRQQYTVDGTTYSEDIVLNYEHVN